LKLLRPIGFRVQGFRVQGMRSGLNPEPRTLNPFSGAG